MFISRNFFVLSGKISAVLRLPRSRITEDFILELRSSKTCPTKSVNKAILIGNLGKDPDVKYTASGVAVAKFSLATNERYKDKSGEWQERVEWHNLVAWQRTAEIVGEYVKKGSKLYIEGRLKTSSWNDKESGDKKYRTEIIVEELVLLGNGNGKNSGDSGEPNGDARGHEKPGGNQNQAYEGAGITDEDLPF